MTQPDRPVTPNRSAGRIEDALWQPFLAKARAEGLTNTDAFRLLIREWTSSPDGPARRGQGRRSRLRGARPG